MTRPKEQFKADLNLWTNRHNGVRKEARRAVIMHTDESAYDHSTGTIRSPHQTWWTADTLAEYNAGGANPRSGDRGSYHMGVDKNLRVVRQVNDRGGTWSTGNAGNNHGIHISLAGTTAHWTRDQWMVRKPQIDKAAEVAAHTAAFHGIPIRKLSPADVRRGAWGITDHDAYSKGLGGSTNWDVGPHFPWDFFMERVAHHHKKFEGKAAPEPAPQVIDPIETQETTLSDIDRRRIELTMDQLAGPGKTKTGEPTFNGWDYKTIVAAAHHNIDNGLGLTLVQQIALVIESQDEQRQAIAGLSAAVTQLTKIMEEK